MTSPTSNNSSSAGTIAGVVAIGFAALLLVLFGGQASTPPPPTTTTTSTSTTTTVRTAASCNVPANYYSRSDVSKLPTLANGWITAIGGHGERLGVEAGPATANQVQGYPVNLLAPGFPMTTFTLGAYAGWADQGTYPVPQWLQYEGGPPGAPLYDGVLLAIGSDCTRYELIGIGNLFGFGPGSAGLPGPYKAAGAARWTNPPNPHAVNGAPAGITAARVPLSPLVATWAQVQAAVAGTPIDHALHWFSTSCRPGFVWPARATDCSTGTDPTAPPYGAWFRLKANYPTTGLDPAAIAVIRALQIHGMILGDGGTQGIALGQGSWSSTTLAALTAVPLNAFEPVDVSTLPATLTATINDPAYWTTR